MIQDKRISLVIPCRNEARNLHRLLHRVPRWIDEIVVVSNRSTDQTKEVAARYGAVVIEEDRVDNRGIGYGFSLQTGIQTAMGDFIVTMDGDGTYPVEQIVDVVTYAINNRMDFISCNRFPLQNHQAISWIRRLGIWALNTEVTFLYGYPMKDILSGMWVIRRAKRKWLDVFEGGWNLSPEIKLAALESPRITFGEYHITHARREHEGSKQQIWQTGLDHLWFIFKRKWYENTRRNPVLLPSFGR